MDKKQIDDPAMIKVRAIFKKSGLSLIELGKRMGYSDETARQAAWQFMQSHDPRMSMLRKFADAMGVSIDMLGYRGKRMLRKLEVELTECGCHLTSNDFREHLEEQKALVAPAFNTDELVCHPKEAMEYCDVVRKATSCPKLSDFLILRTLMNIRRSH